jgi:hypothetical protein
MTEQINIKEKIIEILNHNKLSDLKNFLSKRKNLNQANTILTYLYHAFQTSGILTTTIAAGYNYRYLIWIGVGLNCTASLINIYVHLNDSMLHKLLNNIKLIKDDKYIDEDSIIDINILEEQKISMK